jgi:hypothetical protein
MTLEDRVERLERELGIEDDYVKIAGYRWPTTSLSIYNADDVACDFEPVSDYLVAADDYIDVNSIANAWDIKSSGVDSAIVDETYGYWTSDIDDEVLDEYLVTLGSDDDDKPEWWDTFDNIVYHGTQELIEIDGNPAIVETSSDDYMPIGQLQRIFDAGWRVRCVHGPDHASAHPEVADRDATIVRFSCRTTSDKASDASNDESSTKQ